MYIYSIVLFDKGFFVRDSLNVKLSFAENEKIQPVEDGYIISLPASENVEVDIQSFIPEVFTMTDNDMLCVNMTYRQKMKRGMAATANVDFNFSLNKIKIHHYLEGSTSTNENKNFGMAFTNFQNLNLKEDKYFGNSTACIDAVEEISYLLRGSIVNEFKFNY